MKKRVRLFIIEGEFSGGNHERNQTVEIVWPDFQHVHIRNCRGPASVDYLLGVITFRMTYGHIAAKAIESGGKLRVRSALNPILWLCAIVSVPSMLAAAVMQSAPLWLVALASAPVCAAILGFLFLLVVDRDKLQSEDYQIRKRSLELIEQKGDSAPLAVDPARLEVIAKPVALASHTERDSP